MNIVLVTGQLAYDVINSIVANYVNARSGVNVTVIKLPIQVAAMMNEKFLERELPKYMELLRNADIIIVPGYTSGDLTEVSKIIGKPVVKGVKYAGDIPLMLDALLNGLQLSPITPADELIQQYLVGVEKTILKSARQKAFSENYFLIGGINGIPVSRHYPCVLAEIFISEDQSSISVGSDILKYADVLVIGFPYEFSRERAKRIIELLRGVGKPLGIDSPDLELIKEISPFIDIVMNISLKDIQGSPDLLDVMKDKPVVIVPDHPEHEIDNLLLAVQKIREMGLTKIIVDPVLNPPLLGLAHSLKRYMALREKLPNTPLLMGVGNVTELMDADSIGVNALLASIGVEIGIELYLTTEASVKTRGCVRELRRALDMMVISKTMNRPPKDLSTNLLVLKDKRLKGYMPMGAQLVVEANKRPRKRVDPGGCVKIYVDHTAGKIILEHFPLGSSRPDIAIAGEDPYAILGEIMERNLISLPEHYFYIGLELCKAFISLKTGKEYVQDMDMF
ncbi:MAG: dihydropteroate synthase-like protein [Desulfurococcaceae archaeon]